MRPDFFDWHLTEKFPLFWNGIEYMREKVVFLIFIVLFIYCLLPLANMNWKLDDIPFIPKRGV